MKAPDFDTIAEERFDFLIKDYGFRLIQSKKQDWGGYELLFLNQTTGVQIIYEFQEAYVFITLYQLENGVLIENPVPLMISSAIHGYGLDDIISLRAPHDLLKPAYKYPETSEYFDKEKGLTLFVSAFADNLKRHAQDVLTGDFTIFDKLEKIVKNRITKYQ